ncbi:hypothetical protein YC2023_010639 [Brassica napus]
MASEKFGPHLPTILEAKHIEALYKLWGVDYAVEIKLPDDDETPETVRPGYCGAYTSHFEDGGLSFPLPRFLLKALTELGIAFSQMASNFFRYFLASWIRAREEGLKFGLEELRQLFAIKRNSGFPGTMILTPRPGRSIIDGIPNMDDRWREKFLFFKINLASVCDFDFGRVPREWSDEIEPFGPAPMKPELRGLIATLRRGSPRWLAFTAQSLGLLARPVSIAVPVGGARRAPNTSAGSVGDRALDDDVHSSTHRLTDAASGEGTSKVDQSAHLPDVHETSSWRFLYDNEVPILGNPESLALIWRKIKEKGCELPSLGDMRERDAYVWMAVANAKASNEYTTFMERRLADFPRKEEVEGHLLTIQQLRGELEAVRVTEKQCGVEVEGLKGKLSATETEKVAIQNDLDSMKEKHRREIKGRDAAARKEHNLARRSLAREYDAVLAVVKDKLQKKKEESAAEIR